MSAPASAPPAGGNQDNSRTLLVVIWVEASLGAIVMIARLFTRTYIAHNLGWDDFWMLVTWICGLIGNCLDTVGLHYGIARHMYYLSPEDASKALKMDWVTHAFILAATNLGKVSFAVFLLRIIPKSKKRMRWFLYGYNILLIAINIPLIILTYAQCNPVAGLWNPRIGAKCLPPHIHDDYGLFQGSYGVAADLVLAIFPVFIIWNLQVSRRTKLGLASLMCLGVFAAGCALAKVYYVPLMTHRGDFTWESQYMIIWFTSETYAIIIAATVPTLPPLFAWITGKNPQSGGQRKHPYQPYDDDNSHGMGDLYAKSNNKKGHHHHDTFGRPDSALQNETDSDQRILSFSRDIQRTTEINVSYGAAAGEGDGGENEEDKIGEWRLPSPDEERRAVHAEDNL